MRAVKTVFFIALTVGALMVIQEGKKWITTSPFFTVSLLEISGNRHLSPQEVKRLAHIPRKQNIFTLDVEEVHYQVLNHPWVKRATVKRKFPRTVKIDLVEREAVAVLEGRPEALLDGEGVVLEVSVNGHGQKLPRISSGGQESVIAGQHITGKEALKALEIIKAISLLSFLHTGELHRVDTANPGRETIYLRGEETPIVIGAHSIGEKLNYLYSIKDHLEKRGNSIQYLDLTFQDKVVVKYHTEGRR